MTIQTKEKKRQVHISNTSELPEIAIKVPFSFQEESLEELYVAIKQLSDLDRAIIVLHLEERTYREIARILGTTSNNIGVRIQRIKKKLKQLIIKKYE